MADVVNKISRTVKKVARKTTKKVGEIANVTKYTVKLKAKDADLGEKLERLGKLYYSYIKNENEDVKAELDKCLKEVDELNAEIAEIRKAIAKAKDEIKCTKCGSYVSSSKEACPNCKTSLERIEIAPEANDEK